MKIGIAQIDTIAGDFAATAERVVKTSRQAVIEGAELLVFPACVLTGSLCLPQVEQGRQMIDLLDLFKDLSNRVACPCILPVNMMVNEQAICEAFYVSTGEALPMRLSAYLRYILARGLSEDDANSSGTKRQEELMRGVAAFEFADMSLAVVFDYDDLDTLTDYDFDVDAVIYIPTSGYVADDPSSVLGSAITEGRFRDDVREADIWLVAVGSIGCYDTQVFTGGSFVLTPWGELAAVAPAFEEALVVCEIGPIVECPLSNPLEPEVYNHAFHCWETLCLGVRDFVHKLGLTGVSLLLDGTLSSMALAVLAIDALGPTNVNVLQATPLKGTKLYERGLRSVASSEKSSDSQTNGQMASKAWQRVLVAAQHENVCRQIVANLRVRSFERNENLVRATAAAFDSAHKDEARLAAAALEADVAQAELLALARRTGTLALSSRDKTWLALEADGGPLNLKSNTLSVTTMAGLLPFGDIYRSDLLRMSHMRNTISPMIPNVTLTACDIPLLSRVAPQSCTATGSATLSALEGLSKELQLQHIDAVLDTRLEKEGMVDDAISTHGEAELVEAIFARMDACAVARQTAGPILKASSATLFEVRRPYGYAWHEHARSANNSNDVFDSKSLLRYVAERMGYVEAAENPGENLTETKGDLRRELIDLMGILADMSTGIGKIEIADPKCQKSIEDFFQFGEESQPRWDGSSFFRTNPFSEN